MTVSVAAPTRVSVRTGANPQAVYTAALAFWVLTRLLVLVHQGAWPWMNAFVVAAARGIVVGDWNDAVRPQLPAVMGVPLVLAGATEQQMVAVLYLVASLVQFGAFLVLIRTVFPERLQEQTVALLAFLLVPFNHSIHHYRDMPVVLASAAIFLLSADFVRTLTEPRSVARTDRFASAGPLGLADRLTAADPLGHASRSASADPLPSVGPPPSPAASPWAALFHLFHAMSLGRRPSFFAQLNFKASRGPSRGASHGDQKRHGDVTKWAAARYLVKIAAITLLGVWSRIEVLAFVAVLILAALVVYRRRVWRLVITYAAAAVVVTGSLLFVYGLEDVDLSQAWFYTAHTFLDSTPDSWLSPACQADPTENCREADGLSYFGPANLRDGVLALAMNHPLTTLAKSVRSAWDNTWTLLGPNLSTYPGTIPFLVLVVALMPAVRPAYQIVPRAAWIAVGAIVAESALPPLTWAPPHPQYHVALVLPIVLLLVPALVALLRMPRGRWLAFGYLFADGCLSAFRYTRYAGY